MSPIVDLQRRLHEAGRIRIGRQVPTSGGKLRPAKLETFRFTTRNRAAATELARLYGGECKPWADAPADKQFEVISDATELDVLVPPEEMAFSQWYELWKSGGIVRRCDGAEMVNTGEACICDPEERECKPHTRLSVMLQRLTSSGMWRLDTSGTYAAHELSGAFELARMISQASGRAVLTATLRLEQRERKTPGQGVRRFAVPVLDFPVDPRTLAGDGPVERLGVTPVPALEAPSFEEQLASVDNPPARPARANAAAPVKPTGVKPRPARLPAPVKPEQGQETPENGTAGASDEGPKAEQGEIEGRPVAVECADYFWKLGGAQRWNVLHARGWVGTRDGNDLPSVTRWLTAQGDDKVQRIFEELTMLKPSTSLKEQDDQQQHQQQQRGVDENAGS